jgi:hypothetical protein
MIEPTQSLFYDIISELFKRNAIFASRAVSKIKLVEKDDKRCPTLCIDAKGVILVNKGFWRKYIKTKADAKFVLLHEMFHSVLADNKELKNAKDKYEAQLMNLSMDIRINAAICTFLMKNDIRYKDIFLHNFYPKTGVAGLLRPKSSYSARSKYNLIYRMLYMPKDLSSNEEEMVSNMFKSEEKIRKALEVLIPRDSKESTQLYKIVFLGSHDPGEGDGEEEEKPSENDSSQSDYMKNENQGNDEEKEDEKAKELIQTGLDQDDLEDDSGDEQEMFNDDLREALSEALSIGGQGAGLGGTLFNSIVNVIEASKPASLKALSAFSCSHKLNTLKGFYAKERKVSSMVPLCPSNRELIMLAAGAFPFKWTNRSLRMQPNNNNVAIYLDVSGSVGPYLPKLLGLIASLRQDIETVFCFSTRVYSHTMEELNEGKFKTTGGTDFDCVINHAVEEKIDKMILLTDGCAWLTNDSAELAKKHIKDAAVVFFGHKMKDNFFSTTYGNNFELEDLIVK